MSDKNQNIIRRIISNLNIKDFSTFSLELMRNTYKDHINYYDKIGFEAFIRDLPMGDLGDTFYDSGFKGIYIVDDSPYDMLTNMDKLNIESPKLIEKLNIVKHDFKDKYFQPGPDQIVQNNLNAIYFLTNLSGYDENFYIDKLIPKYYDLIKKLALI